MRGIPLPRHYRIHGNRRIRAGTVLIAAALYLTAFTNFAFFRNLQAISLGSEFGLFHVISFALVLAGVMVITLASLCWGRAIKPLLIVLVMVSSVTAYFMDSFNVIIGRDMLLNVMATDSAEIADLLTARLFLYLAFLGLLPSILIWKLPIAAETFKTAMFTRLKIGMVALLVIVALVAGSSAFYTSIIREHKSLRYYTNPLTPIYSAYKLARTRLPTGKREMEAIGEDARIPTEDVSRELIIMVVGETSRADRYSLNGYERPTNPLLAERDLVSFTDVSSCATSTAISLPCMFSLDDRNEFKESASNATENLLDVLSHAGVNMLWRDNNSSSKGVSDRIQTEDFRSPEVNPVCDIECRDEGLLAGLQDYVDQQGSGDILIILHQMGSHGPAYYKRYPPAFEVFKPTCKSSLLDECSTEEINNTYDNTILYTDYFLSLVIDFLRDNDERFETAMLYVSDHGESLGEYGLYLHGLPYVLAPETQTHVPVIMWFGRNYDDADIASVRHLRDTEMSHDNIFHTMLGFFEINSGIHDPEKDILQLSRDLVSTPREYP